MERKRLRGREASVCWFVAYTSKTRSSEQRQQLVDGRDLTIRAASGSARVCADRKLGLRVVLRIEPRRLNSGPHCWAKLLP